jgi:two-component system NtrC family sensor kinase
MLEAFVWTDRFATGIASVDDQHRHLVDLVNQLGDQRVSGHESNTAELQALFRQLADYARFHFTDEERVMTEAGLDSRYIETHKRQHRSFTEQVVTMWQGRSSMSDPVGTLHGFLSAWLTFHILGEDQAMARQVNQIAQGIPASAALDREVDKQGEQSATALLAAMEKLYDVLSRQNHDLAAVNADLEARVAARTEELNTAYVKLEADNRELSNLLAKVEQAQSQLLQSEKMASIGQLAAGVAHEINNPIGFVSSNLGTLTRYVEDILRVVDAGADNPAAEALAREIDLPFLRTDLHSLLSESQDGLDRVRKIVANLKDFSHVDQAEWQHADLLAGLESTVNVVWHELKYKTDIVRELQPLPLVRCMPAQINQVLMNLLINAVQAIAERGTITLRSGKESDRVWLEIADNGKGMDETVKQRMFEPFFTTKPVGKGTGLGMSLAYDIIHKHGGSFDVESAPGKGTRIRIWLPIDGPQDNNPAA